MRFGSWLYALVRKSVSSPIRCYGSGRRRTPRPAVAAELLEDRSLLTPTVTIGFSPSSSISEWNATNNGPESAYVYFSVDETPTSDLTISYSIGGIATAGTDYTGSSGLGTVTITAGSTGTGMEVYFTAIADGVIEGDESITVTVPTTSDYNGGSGTLTITDEPLPRIAIDTYMSMASDMAEWDSTMNGPRGVNVNFTRSGASLASALTVNYSVSGTAIDGTDFNPSPALTGLITIPANSTSASIWLNPLEDTLDEGTEPVIFTLSSSSDYILGSTSTFIINLLDTPKPTVTIDMYMSTSSDMAEWDDTLSGPRGVNVNFTRNDSSLTNALTVNYTVSGSATNGVDYTATPLLSGSITIPANSSSASIWLNPIPDAINEGMENVILTLSSSSVYTLGLSSSLTVALLDAPPPTVSIQSFANASEWDEFLGTPVNGSFWISRSGPGMANPLTVNVTIGGSATNGTDYNASAPLTTTVTIPAGSSGISLSVNPEEDTDYSEGTEDVILTLAAGAYAFDPTNPSATVTIADAAKPEVTAVAFDPDAAEGYNSDVTMDPGSLVISRTGSTTFPLTVNLDPPSGTATNGADYTGMPSGSIVIPAGSSSVTITITPSQDDNFLEGDELVELNLGSGTDYVVPTSTVTTVPAVTIKDVNRAPNVASKYLTVTPNASGILYNVGATDPDTGQTLTYFLRENDTGNASTNFSIDSNGNITITGGFLTAATYDLAVEVTDNGGPPPKQATATIFINVANFNATPYSVDFLNSHSIKTDPTSANPNGTEYPTIEWTIGGVRAPVAYTSGLGTSNKRLQVTAKFTVSNNWSYSPTQIRGNAGGYILPATNVSVNAGGPNYDILKVTTTATTDFLVGAKYDPSFTTTWEINIGGSSWITIGSTSNPLYLTWKDPSTTLYRTVLHIGSTRAQGILTESSVISAIWGEFDVCTVTRWNGGSALIYNHRDEASLDDPLVPDFLENHTPNNTEELLLFGHGQCNAWTQFFLDTLKAQGIASGTEKSIVANEANADGFLVSGWDFGGGAFLPGAPAGYHWKMGEIGAAKASQGDSIESQGHPTGANAPGQHFPVHFVVAIGTVLYDPSYGVRFESAISLNAALALWETSAIAGVYSGPATGSFFAKRRTAADSGFVRFG